MLSIPGRIKTPPSEGRRAFQHFTLKCWILGVLVFGAWYKNAFVSKLEQH